MSAPSSTTGTMTKTPRARSRLAACLLVSALSLSLAGCGGDEDSTGVVLDLAGSYALLSVASDGQPTLTPPAATGTLVLTADRYEIDLAIGPEIIMDTGTYEVAGNAWSQTSDTGAIQSVGTVTLNDGVLTVDATTVGVRTVSVWQRS